MAKLIWKIRAVAAACAGLFATSLPAHAEDLISLYTLAEQGDPEFQAAMAENRSIWARTGQARAALLPGVNFNAAQSWANQDIVSSDNAVFATGSTSFPTTEYSVVLDQPIFNIAGWHGWRRAKREAWSADARLTAAKQDLILRVAEIYFSALSATENLEFVQAEKRSIEEHLQQVQARERRGLARAADLSDARARQLLAEAREQEVLFAIRDFVEGVRQLTGQRPASLNKLVENLQLVDPDPTDPSSWLDQAINSNPRIVAAELTYEAARADLNSQRGRFAPRADVSYEYNSRDTDGTLFGGGSEVETSTVFLRLNVPIFNGGLVAHQVREAKHFRDQVKYEAQQEKRLIERNTLSSYNGVSTAILQVRAFA